MGVVRWEILDELNSGRLILLHFRSLYPALNPLENKHYVTWLWGDVSVGRESLMGNIELRNDRSFVCLFCKFFTIDRQQLN